MVRDKPLTTGRFLFIWGVQLPVTAIVVSILLLWVGPKEPYGPWVCYLSAPYDSGIGILRVEAYATRAVWTRAVVEIHAEDSRTRDCARAEVDLISAKVSTAYPFIWGGYDPNPPSLVYAEPRPLNQGEVLAWFGFVGADVDGLDIQDLASELASIIEGIPQHGLLNLTPTHFEYTNRSAGTRMPAVWFMKSLLIFWLVVWLAGFVCFFVIKRRRTRAAEVTSEPMFDDPDISPDDVNQ
jgi:hypothetical protein